MRDVEKLQEVALVSRVSQVVHHFVTFKDGDRHLTFVCVDGYVLDYSLFLAVTNAMFGNFILSKETEKGQLIEARIRRLWTTLDVGVEATSKKRNPTDRSSPCSHTALNVLKKAFAHFVADYKPITDDAHASAVLRQFLVQIEADREESIASAMLVPGSVLIANHFDDHAFVAENL